MDPDNFNVERDDTEQSKIATSTIPQVNQERVTQEFKCHDSSSPEAGNPTLLPIFFLGIRRQRRECPTTTHTRVKDLTSSLTIPIIQRLTSMLPIITRIPRPTPTSSTTTQRTTRVQPGKRLRDAAPIAMTPTTLLNASLAWASASLPSAPISVFAAPLLRLTTKRLGIRANSDYGDTQSMDSSGQKYVDDSRSKSSPSC